MWIHRARVFSAAAFCALLLPASTAAEVLVLTNGREIVVERFWEQGEQIFYEKNGSLFGFPRELLERVEGVGTSATEDEPAGSRFENAIASDTLMAAREALRAKDLRLAERLYRRAIARAPDVVEARVELAELYLRQDRLGAARDHLRQAIRLAPDRSRIRERLGDVFYRLGQTGLAIREWQLALADYASPGLMYKLRRALRENDDDIIFERDSPARFLIRYDGHVDETMGRLVAAALEEEFSRLEQTFRFRPGGPIEVTLYTNREFQDVPHAPSWASGLNDGHIRIPVEGLADVTPRLRRVIRHELTHSFVRGLTEGNCPAWFHEGLAQLGEGADRSDPYARLRAAQSEGRLLPLWTLEGPLTSLDKEQALLVYAEALAATEYLEARRGPEAHFEILRALAAGLSMDEALKSVIGLDYRELQTAWEADLARYRSPAR